MEREVTPTGNSGQPSSGTHQATDTVAGSTAAARLLHTATDVNAPRAPQGNQVLLGRAVNDLANTPPTTPVSRLASGLIDTPAAARSFIDNLHALHFEGTNDSESLTTAFLKLEVTNMSTNQDMERLLNEAKHLIREAALAVAKAQVDQGLLGKAGQLEKRAADMIRRALRDSGRTDTRTTQALDDMEKASSGTPMSQQAASQSWRRVYDAAGRAVRESARAHKEEKDARARGDHHAAHDAHQRAKAADSRARAMLEAARIKVSDPEAMREMAEDMNASGEHGNVISKYLDKHPEAAQGAMSAERFAEVQGQGGQAIADAALDGAATRAASGDAASVAELGRATNAASRQAVSELQSGLSANDPLRRALGTANGMFAQADTLRNQATATRTGIAAAEKVVAEGRTDDGEFGVQRRNMERQDDIMRGITRLLGGTRADQQAREEANREARRAHVEVVRLLRDFVEREKTSTSRRVPDRI